MAALALPRSRLVAATAASDGDRRLEPAAMASSGRAIVLGALLAGLAVGFRSQTLWITVPLLLLVLADRIGRGVAGAMLGSAHRLRRRRAGLGRAAAWSPAAGCRPTWRRSAARPARTSPASRCCTSIPAPRLAAFALLRTFVWPWDSVPLAAWCWCWRPPAWSCCWLRERRTLAAVAAISRAVLVVPPGVPGHDLRPLRAARGVAGGVPCRRRARCGRARRGHRRRRPGRVESERRRAAAVGLRRARAARPRGSSTG